MTSHPQMQFGRDRELRHTPHVQSSDLEAAMRDRAELNRQVPETPKPREMIEQVRIIGQDKLTAADQALYDGLLAWAQDHGPDADHHEIPLDAIMGYAGITGTDELVSMMHRLGTTHVKYDIRTDEWRRRGTLPFILAEVAENLKRVDGFVRYSIPEPVRRLMIAPRSYAFLELAALPRFKSRYSSRLYQRLALRAGYSLSAQGPWEIEPEKLAASVGFKWTRYADFRRIVLEPALDDIRREVKRFSVACTPVHALGRVRGRPAVARLRFETTPMMIKPLAALQAASLSMDVAAYIQRPDARIEPRLIPSASTIARLVTYRATAHPMGRDISPPALADHWRAAIDEAITGTIRNDARPPVAGNDLWGDDLLKAVDLVGLDNAMRVWIDSCEWTGRYMQRSESISVTAPEPVLVVVPSQETREDKCIRLTRRNAAGELETLERLPSGSDSYPRYIAALLDPEVGPWSYLVEEHKAGRMLAAALRALGRKTDLGRQRQTAINLLTAVAEYNLGKVEEISRAVIASATEPLRAPNRSRSCSAAPKPTSDPVVS